MAFIKVTCCILARQIFGPISALFQLDADRCKYSRGII
jgi:hypothetical protein